MRMKTSAQLAGATMPRRRRISTIGEVVAQHYSNKKTRSYLLVLLLALVVIFLTLHTPSLRLHLEFQKREREATPIHSLPTKHPALVHQEDEQTDEHEKKIVIFYNLYIGNESDIPRIRTLVQDQFHYWNATRHASIYVTSIGVNVSSLLLEGDDMFFPHTLPVHRVAHKPTGSELLTLDALWGYCQDQPSATVAYLHSKGSFHPTPENEVLRRLLTQAALSRDCFGSVTAEATTTTTPNNNIKNSKTSTTADDNSNNSRTKSCNTCSFRMSPYPHMHTPGNMWLAQCAYVRHLLRPSVFASRMDVLYGHWAREPHSSSPCAGVGRYAAEHWVHTHPDSRPCDLYRPDNFTWGYAGLPVQLPPPMETEPEDENEKEWIRQNWHVSVAPRFDEAVYRRSDRCLPMYNISRVLDQFQRLYGLTPAEDWWGWSWYDFDTAAMAASVVTSSSL
jgi:hypothetical protein